eukprot:TRINITY_DN23232_c0_g1_i1.p1 TRINITY_DN23232_c0_g1~~TRINITY_DN23232_c0_g1_i1.p1  ORF type:complete len:400 (-),score=66.53 TRINITY_DN23232_c0_g1_i1:30-1229(-)
MAGASGPLSLASHVLCSIIFLLLCLWSLTRIMPGLGKLQAAQLRTRLRFAVASAAYLCVMSTFLGLVHCTDFEYQMQELLGKDTLIIRPLEYLLSCHVMMLSLVILSGEETPIRRQVEVVTLTIFILLSGFAANCAQTGSAIKWMFFSTGCLAFVCLSHRLEVTVQEHSKRTERLFSISLHGSVFKHLVMKVILTWIMFPIWWLISADGLDLVHDPDANVLVTASLNIFAKGLYVVFVVNMYDKYACKDDLVSHACGQRDGLSNEISQRAALEGPLAAVLTAERRIMREQQVLDGLKKLAESDCSNQDYSKCTPTSTMSPANSPRIMISNVSMDTDSSISSLQLDQRPSHRSELQPATQKSEPPLTKLTIQQPAVLGSGVQQEREPSRASSAAGDNLML